MEWLISHGCPVDDDVCFDAVRYAVGSGSTAALESLRQSGLIILIPDRYMNVLHDSARKHEANALTLVRWLREVAECPWHAAKLAERAAAINHLQVLQYVHEHGGPFTAEQLAVQLRCAYLRYPEVCQWLRKQGA